MSDSDLEKSPVSVKRARESSFDSNGAEQTSPPPIVATDPKDQVQMITDLQGQFLQDGSVAYLISKQWFTRWKQYCSRLSSSQQDARKIGEQTNPGPINNKSILTPEGKLIKDLVYNESVFAIPIQAWEKLVEWYGITPPDADPIERQVIQKKDEVTVELYPPTFRLYAIESSSNSSFISNSTMTRCPVITLSETNLLQDLVSSIRNAFDLTPTTEIQAWILQQSHTTPTISVSSLGNGATLIDLDTELSDLSQYSGQEYNIAIEVKNDGNWPSENKEVDSSSSVSSASSLLFANGFNNLTTSSTTTPPLAAIEKYIAPTPRFTRGVCGLQNLGNTCFMNSALQCLSNTPQLTKYFLADLFKRDLNPDNPLGMKGQVAEAYGELVQKLWSGTANSIAPRDFKYTIGRFNSSFSGYQQHDTQELLAFLLDGLHEDLNRIIKKPYIELPDFDGMQDDEIAAKSWDYHKARNDSVIVDLFQGQFKSRLICEECKNVSVTFDPFMYLSLPLPIKKKCKTTIVYVPYDPSKRLQRVVVTLSKEASIAHLQKEVAKMMSVEDPNALLVVEIFSRKIYKVFAQYEPVATIGTSDIIYVYELPGPVPPLPVIKKKPYKYRYNSLPDDEAEEQPEPTDPNQLIVFPVYCATVEKSDSNYVTERINQFGDPIVLAVPYKDANNPELLYSLVSQHVERYTQFKLFEEVYDRQPMVTAHVEEDGEVLEEASAKETFEEINGGEQQQMNGISTALHEDDVLDYGNDDEDEIENEFKMMDSEVEEDAQTPAYLQPQQKDENMEIDQVPATPVHTAAAVTAAGGKKVEPMSNLFAMKVFSGSSSRYSRGSSEELLPTTQSWSSNLIDLTERAQSEQKQLQAYIRQQNGEESSSSSGSEEEDTEMEDSIVLPSKIEDDDEVEDAAALFSSKDDDSTDDITVEFKAEEKEEGELDEDETEADSNANDASYRSDNDSDREFLTNNSIVPPPQTGVAITAFAPAPPPPPTKAPVLPKRKIRPPPETIIRQGEGILLAWTPKKAEQLFGTARHHGGVCTDAWDDMQELGDPEAATATTDQPQKKKQLTLSDCLDEFTKEEELSEEDLWYCPKCKKHQRATKKFDLWRMPDILVVHLKRFSHSRTWRDKIDALIDFPTSTVLDLTERVLSIPDHENVAEEDRLVYDLYGVDNHYGGLGGGHYTSFAQNFEDGQWYNFDDSHVTKVQDVDDVKTTAAYLLFYKRRKPQRESSQSVEEIIQETQNKHQQQQALAAQQEEEVTVALPPQYPFINQLTTTTTSSSSSSDIEEDQTPAAQPPSYEDITTTDWMDQVDSAPVADEPISEWLPSDTEEKDTQEQPYVQSWPSAVLVDNDKEQQPIKQWDDVPQEDYAVEEPKKQWPPAANNQEEENQEQR